MPMLHRCWSEGGVTTCWRVLWRQFAHHSTYCGPGSWPFSPSWPCPWRGARTAGDTDPVPAPMCHTWTTASQTVSCSNSAQISQFWLLVYKFVQSINLGLSSLHAYYTPGTTMVRVIWKSGCPAFCMSLQFCLGILPLANLIDWFLSGICLRNHTKIAPWN